MEGTLEMHGETGMVMLRGNLTVQHAAVLKNLLMRGLESSSRVVLSFEHVEEVDLSCMQLICAAHRTAVRMQKSVYLSGNVPEIFRQAIQDSGFKRHVGCSFDAGNSCAWMGMHSAL
ncbi:MAG TPA: STAS domain-containing protein [Dissulfurispiraceae bacterium]|nr:STAS domain-containing protein [Dissulfurispiraceae bacterium]